MGASGLLQLEREHARQAAEDFVERRDPSLRNEIVSRYQGLAYALACRFTQRGEELDDLNQVAMIGLMKAVDRFDPHRGVELTTFATATINGELKRHLRDRGWCVRLPRRVHDLHLRSQQVIDELTQEFGRSPTMFEVADRVDAPLEDVIQAIDAAGLRHNASLEATAGPGEEVKALGNQLVDGDEDLADVDHRLALGPLLSRLPTREQEILRLRFVSGCSQSEIAREIGVSQMQVSRLLSRTLSQLRRWAEAG